MAGGNGTESSPYVKARIVGGLALILGVILLTLIDAWSDKYTFEIGPMFLMLGTGSVLLGVEAIRRIINGS